MILSRQPSDCGENVWDRNVLVLFQVQSSPLRGGWCNSLRKEFACVPFRQSFHVCMEFALDHLIQPLEGHDLLAYFCYLFEKCAALVFGESFVGANICN